MDYVVGKSENTDPLLAIEEITKFFDSPLLIIYFTPVDLFEEFSIAIHEKYPDSICMGATTRVAITKFGASEKGSVAVSFESGITCVADILENIDKYPIKYVSRVKKCLNKIDETNNTICFELSTALLGGEESVLSTLNSVLLKEKIKVVGGSAGNISGETNYVCLNGRIVENSAVFVLIHNKYGRIHFFRENIYKPLNDNKLVVTDVDIRKRIVREYNHKPAADVYSRELEIYEDQIEEYMDTHPVGRFVGDHMFITANQAVTDERGLKYHARIYNNSRLSVLTPDDYKRVNHETFEKIKEDVAEPQLSILIHCVARTEYFIKNDYMQEYAKKLGETVGDYIGFSGYGEQLSQYNFNMTAIIIVFE